MKASMDRAVDPCQDFYRFSCANFERKHEINEDGFGLLDREVTKNLAKELDNLNPKDPRRSMAMTKQFYDICIQTNRSFSESDLLDYIASEGGWPILNNFNLGEGWD